MWANGNNYDVLTGKYPDIAFMPMVINNLFHHDCEFSEIHQQTFAAIVGGVDIPTARKFYDIYMDEKHLWDD